MQDNKKSIAKFVFVLLIVVNAPAFAMAGECASTTEIYPDSSSHFRGLGVEECETLMFFPQGRGLLHVEVVVPGWAAEPRLELLHRGGRSVDISEFTAPVVQNADMMIIRAAGEEPYIFRVSSQDPTRELGPFKISCHFEASPRAVGPVRRDGEPDDDPDDENEDGAGGPLEIVPLPFSDSPLDETFLCRDYDGTDDHGDPLPCATVLEPGQEVSAQLLNATGDDRDSFAFHLEARSTVVLESHGTFYAFGTLYDSWGHRLVVEDGDRTDTGLRFVKNLAPGYYFVRLESVGSEAGEYRVTLKVLD